MPRREPETGLESIFKPGASIVTGKRATGQFWPFLIVSKVSNNSAGEADGEILTVR
jgi:hypothetical protein